jgi:hypothetical protein
VGYAARVKEGQPLMSVWVYGEQESIAKEALRRAKMKLPVPTRTYLEYFEVDESRLVEIAELERLEDEREARRAAQVAEEEAAAAPAEGEEGAEEAAAEEEEA